MPNLGEIPITGLLAEWRQGDDAALEKVIETLYKDLRRVAAGYVSGRDQPPMPATALVHEFYLRCAGLQHISWESRGQFVAAASKVMRRLLVDDARKRSAAKRGGPEASIGTAEASIPGLNFNILAVHQALDKLALSYPRHAEVVELIFFGGLNAAESAEVLSAVGKRISLRTVERDWRFARAWLHEELGE